MNTNKGIWIIAACVVGALTAGAANATSATNSGQRMVLRYDSKELSTDEGLRRIYRRIRTAAEDVCPVPSGTRIVSGAVQACRDEAIANAIRSIDNPRLAAVAAAKSNKG